MGHDKQKPESDATSMGCVFESGSASLEKTIRVSRQRLSDGEYTFHTDLCCTFSHMSSHLGDRSCVSIKSLRQHRGLPAAVCVCACSEPSG